jgi:hypothetical protein
MAAQPSFKLVKQFTFRGGSGKQWTNRYHFGPDTPTTDAEWDALTDAVVTGEKACLPSYVTIVGSVCYAAGSDLPVHSKTYSTAGTLALGTTIPTPGEAAALIRYSTTARTTKNHPVYLFNYYHGVRLDQPGDNDTVAAAQRTAMGTYATNWVSGGWVAGKSYKRRGPNGATAVGSLVETLVTHRDFPR